MRKLSPRGDGGPPRLLTCEDVAAMLGCAVRTVHERTRRDEIPHRVTPHGRRCLFDEAELAAWMAGAPLERVNLPGNGRHVRPVAPAAA